MLIVKGVNVFPAGINGVISSFIPRVSGQFRIVLTEPPPRVIPPLRVKVELGSGLMAEQTEALKEELAQALHNKLRVTPEIEFLPPETIPRTTKKTDWFERLYEKK
jgi:phenylacetate-CoA ligase